MSETSDGRYRALFENMDEGFCAIEMIHDAQGKPVDYRFLEINRTFVRQTGLDQALEKTMREMVPDHDEHWFEIYGKVARTGESIRFQNPAAAMGRFYDVFAFRIGGEGSREVGILFNDVTESKRMQEALKRSHDDLEDRVKERTALLAKANDELRDQIAQRVQAELEKEKLQLQLLQSQKMEAVGRLAGGVAHDFNNLLTGILGYSRFLLDGTPLDDPRRADMEEIKKAGERASSLTRQLLAFSRQQVLKPRVLELNEIVREMEKMLKRLIGEDVALDARLAADLGRIKADPGQIEQILMNLVVNARDAMPQGGKLAIETANIDLGEDYAQTHLEVRPGPHVMLAVSDTGSGMDKQTLSRLFEPFFTTKEQGKGTGLGLATVYGIVKQSRGSVFVYSEPGRGTVFKIYFPRVQADAQPLKAVEAGKPARGTETVLLAEDDEMVGKFILRVLTENGYRVLTARRGDEALSLLKACQEPIDLLLSDIVMPGMRGDELAARAAALRPSIKVILMSGYTEAGVVDQDLPVSRVRFIQKPLEPEGLARMVRGVLDEAAA